MKELVEKLKEITALASDDKNIIAISFYEGLTRLHVSNLHETKLGIHGKIAIRNYDNSAYIETAFLAAPGVEVFDLTEETEAVANV